MTDDVALQPATRASDQGFEIRITRKPRRPLHIGYDLPKKTAAMVDVVFGLKEIGRALALKAKGESLLGVQYLGRTAAFGKFGFGDS